MKKKLLLFGATGSIGDSTLDILRQHPDDFELVGFTWHSNQQKANAIQKEFGVGHVFSTAEPDNLARIEALLDVEHDFIIIGIVGAAGVATTLTAARRGETILLANKESLVVAGSVVMTAARKHGATMLPVDSEHSSLFRLLEGNRNPIRNAYLTASGGPLLHVHGDDFYNASKALVLKHPTWVMGQKITVDSAGLANKALEIIEAHHLFDLPYEQIQAVIHPQSYIHAMVEHADGTVSQHISQPDMRYPIAYAMYYPRATALTVPVKSPATYPTLEFYPIDEAKFRSYALGRQAGAQGKYFPAVFNAANEAAVAAFLNENIRFGEIAELIEKALEQKYDAWDYTTIEGLLQFDAAARSFVNREALRT
jgi:1-deoxy-D-xylulose-5-phosphate reductoisomerase